MRAFLSAVMAAVFFCWTTGVGTASDDVTITVYVKDAGTGRGVAGARVSLLGPVLTSDRTDESGAVAFDSLPPGSYTVRVNRSGYVSPPDTRISLESAATVDVRISSRLKVIGTVHVSANAGALTAQSAVARKTSATLLDSFAQLPRVSLPSDETDPSSPVSISLEGHSAAETGISLDGIPLSAPGIAVNLKQLNPDLFSGASVSFGQRGGAAGGTVNFFTLEPTPFWDSTLTLGTGTQGRANSVLSLQGKTGKVGVVLQRTDRTTPQPGDGLVFADDSGLLYTHADVSRRSGDLLKLRFDSGSRDSPFIIALDTDTRSDIVCLWRSGAVPCGYGPGNTADSQFHLVAAGDSTYVGATGVTAGIYGTSGSGETDLSHRLAEGVPEPSYSSGTLRGTGFFIDTQSPLGRHTIGVHVSEQRARLNSTAAAAGVSEAQEQAINSSQLTLSDRLTLSRRHKISMTIGESNNGGFGGVTSGVAETWSPNGSSSLTTSFDAEAVAPQFQPARVLSPASTLLFNCLGHDAFGTAPGDSGTPGFADALRVQYQTTTRLAAFAATLYQQRIRNTTVTALVNASALPAGIVPANYLISAQSIYTTPTICGSQGPKLSDVFLRTAVSGVTVDYTGGSVGGSLQLRPNLSLVGDIDVTRVTTHSDDSRLNNPSSPTYLGSQMPNVPLHGMGVALQYASPGNGFDATLGTRYIDANNSQNLPSHWLTNMSLTKHLQRGILTIVVANLLNAYSGTFADASPAVPLSSAQGSVGVFAQPNAPRSITALYTVSVGRDSQASTLEQSAVASNAAESGVPKMQGYNISGLPEIPPTDPLRVQESNEACGAPFSAVARPLFAKLREYTNAIQADASRGSFPTTAPPAPRIPGISVSYHRSTQTYSLEITTNRIDVIQAVAACAALHVGSVAQAEKIGLFVPAAPPSLVHPVLDFSPRVGFYVIKDAGTGSQDKAKYRLYRLPAQRPAAPFALQSICPHDELQTATRYLGDAQRIAASGWASDDLWHIEPHANTAKPWYAMATADTEAYRAILLCARVAGGTSAELAARGVSAARPPLINYAPELGLYVLLDTPAQ